MVKQRAHQAAERPASRNMASASAPAGSIIGASTSVTARQTAFATSRADVFPVPVYYPEVTEILGATVYRRLVDVPGEIDLVDVFRRPQDIDGHIDDILSKKPKAVWFQSGIRHEPASETLARAGIQVVQDRCLMVEHRSIAAR